MESFGDDAIRAVQLYNWLSDFTSFNPLSDEQEFFKVAHFDNLLSTDMVVNDFSRLATQAKAAIQLAATDGDVRGMLAVLGVSLHGMQDFYTHTNWVERFTNAGEDDAVCYVTLPNVDVAVLEAQDLLTGVTDALPDNAAYDEALNGTDPSTLPNHGSYRCGVNKDSYVNERWLQSRRFAFFATREWVQQLREWADEVSATAWADTLAYAPADSDEEDALAFGLEGARDISMWTKNPFKGFDDGHWKGDGSGNTFLFAAEAAQYVANLNFINSPLVAEMRDGQRHRALLNGMMEGLPAPSPAETVTGRNMSNFEVIVRILAVSKGDRFSDPISESDFYAETTVNGYTYRDSVQLNEDSVEPKWTTVAILTDDPAGPTPAPVPVVLALFDDDTSTDDDPIDISPSASGRTVSFTYDLATGALAGDVSGVHNDAASALTVTGTSDQRASLTFFVTHRVISACPREAVVTPDELWADCSAGSRAAAHGFALFGVAAAAIAAAAGAAFVRA